MKIAVTQRHIVDGQRHSSENCALALAITEATGRKCSVTCGEVWINGHNGPVQLPDTAQRFMMFFDLNFPAAKPFRFEIDYTPAPKLADMALPAFTDQYLMDIAVRIPQHA